MAIVTHLIQLKQPTQKKRRQWLEQQQEYARCINWCVSRLQQGEKLSSANVPHGLKAAIKNEAIRRAKKALADFKNGRAQSIPDFHASVPLSINNQNWDTRQKNGRWYIGFTTNEGKVYLPVVETVQVHSWFPYFQKRKGDANRVFRGTMQLVRKGRHWYAAIPVQVSCELPSGAYPAESAIGVDLGLRQIAVVSEPKSGKRQFFSGKQVGYRRRRFRSMRRSLGKKKAQRAIKRIGQKEKRWITDYNRKLAKEIITFAQPFPRPVIKMEQLARIRQRNKAIQRPERTIHSWAFYQLQRFILEMALKAGIPVVFVSPAYTSQRCYACGYTDKANRNKDRFHCKSCGHKTHADYNAGCNIARSTSLAA